MSPPLTNNLFFLFRDTTKRQSDSMWTLQNQAPLLSSPYMDMAIALSQCSNAAPFGALQQMYSKYLFEPSVGITPNVTWQAIIPVVSVAMKDYIVIPQPVAGMIASDMYTIKMTFPPLVRFMSYANEVLGDSAGNPWIRWGPGWVRQQIGGPGA